MPTNYVRSNERHKKNQNAGRIFPLNWCHRILLPRTLRIEHQSSMYNCTMEDTKPIPAFRKVLKRYRRQPVEGLDNSDLIDFLVGDERVVDIVCDESSTADIYRGRLFGLKGFPGFLYAPSALSDEVQRAFGLAAVSEYCEKPHATNIDAVPPKASEVIADDDDTMWNLWKHEHGFVARSSGNSSSHTNDRKKNTHSPRYYRSFGKLSRIMSKINILSG